MSLFQSPSHTFATTQPELFSTSDETEYAAILLIARPGNVATLQFGGPTITSAVGGMQLDASGVGAYLIAVPGKSVRLTQLFVAGQVGDSVDTVCVPAAG